MTAGLVSRKSSSEIVIVYKQDSRYRDIQSLRCQYHSSIRIEAVVVIFNRYIIRELVLCSWYCFLIGPIVFCTSGICNRCWLCLPYCFLDRYKKLWSGFCLTLRIKFIRVIGIRLLSGKTVLMMSPRIWKLDSHYSAIIGTYLRITTCRWNKSIFI